MGLELGSGGKEEHTQERLVPGPGVCVLVDSARRHQLSLVSRGRKAMTLLSAVPHPQSCMLLAPEAPQLCP